jgi:hypothetical protein
MEEKAGRQARQAEKQDGRGEVGRVLQEERAEPHSQFIF